jgi:hypothetical protein
MSKTIRVPDDLFNWLTDAGEPERRSASAEAVWRLERTFRETHAWKIFLTETGHFPTRNRYPEDDNP